MDSKTLEEIQQESSIFDSMFDIISNSQGGLQTKFNNIQRVINKIADSNIDVLQSNIVGKQLLFNDKAQDDILNVMGLSSEKSKKIIAESPFIKMVGASSMRSQMAFLIPCAIFAGILTQQKMIEEAEMMFLIMFFKPWAARISNYFKHGVNEGRMAYTIEHMDERSDIKTQGTVLSLLTKISKSSYDNYSEALMPKNIPGDKLLYDVSMSGCYTRVNAAIKKIYIKYDVNKGKTLGYESIMKMGVDDKGDAEAIENEIESESAIKMSISRSAMSKLTRSPIDEKLLQVAVVRSFASGTLSATRARMDILRSMINDVVDNDLNSLNLLINYTLDSFTSQLNSRGDKYTASEIRTPVFLSGAMKIFKSPNSKNVNLLNAKTLLDDLMNIYSNEYVLLEKNTKRLYKNAFYFYIVMIIRKS